MKRFGLSKSERLASKKSIARVFTKGRQVSNNYILARWFVTHGEEGSGVLVGFSVPKRKISSAVKRNRVKRLMRESYRVSKHMLTEGPIEDRYKLEIMLVYLRNEIPTFAELQPRIESILKTVNKRISKINS